jgi:integrase
MQFVQPIRDYEKIKAMQQVLRSQSDRDWLLFTMGINSGLHLIDLLQLRVRDVKELTSVTIVESNTGKSKSFILTEELKAVIAAYIRDMKDDDYLFRSRRTGLPIKRIRVYRILNNAARQIGLEDVGTHTLRKTFGYHTYKKTKNLMGLKELFNHSAPSVTLRYIGVEEDQARP